MEYRKGISVEKGLVESAHGGVGFALAGFFLPFFDSLTPDQIKFGTLLIIALYVFVQRAVRNYAKNVGKPSYPRRIANETNTD